MDFERREIEHNTYFIASMVRLLEKMTYKQRLALISVGKNKSIRDMNDEDIYNEFLRLGDIHER